MTSHYAKRGIVTAVTEPTCDEKGSARSAWDWEFIPALKAGTSLPACPQNLEASGAACQLCQQNQPLLKRKEGGGSGGKKKADQPPEQYPDDGAGEATSGLGQMQPLPGPEPSPPLKPQALLCSAASRLQGKGRLYQGCGWAR